MKKIVTAIILLSFVSIYSCSSEAEDLCECFKEAYDAEGEEGEKKAQECIKMHQKLMKKYKNDEEKLKEFEKALDECSTF
jgi:hypothetical protein